MAIISYRSDTYIGKTVLQESREKSNFLLHVIFAVCLKQDWFSAIKTVFEVEKEGNSNRATPGANHF